MLSNATLTSGPHLNPKVIPQMNPNTNPPPTPSLRGLIAKTTPRNLMVSAITGAVVALASCSHAPKRAEVAAPLEESLTRIQIMTYNVENLFDTTHDHGKEDFAFLPLKKKQTRAHKAFCEKIKVPKWKDECLLKDWTEDKLKEKMRRLATTVLGANDGVGPDVLVLQEVENLAVLQRWNREHLGNRYKEVVLIEGPDVRGIDVAIMSKLPLLRPAQLHKIPFVFDDPKRAGDTRGVLEAELGLPDGEKLAVMAVHLPNPAHPHELRTQAFAFLGELAKSTDPKRHVVVAGDVNVTKEEDAKLQRSEALSKDWFISHRVGCKDCKGTYYYPPKTDWSFLDWIMFSKSLAPDSKGWRLVPQSVQLWTKNPQQLDAEGFPASFIDERTSMGVADHLPLMATIVSKIN